MLDLFVSVSDHRLSFYFRIPLPPFPRTMLLYPLEEEVEKYKKKYSELQKVMTEYKDTVDMPFDEFFEKVA